MALNISSTDHNYNTDWTRCCLCQLPKKEPLKSPGANPSKRGEDGYRQLSRNIPQFLALNQMPIKFDPRRLDEGNGIEETLRERNAQYHESCRLCFNNSKLQRAQKRSTLESTTDGAECSSSKIPRKVPDPKIAECFFCEKGIFPENMREAMTMKLNKRVNECARRLNDGKLLAKLSAGDVVAQEVKYHPSCLVALYNRERTYLNAQHHDSSKEHISRKEACAFSELVTYINETKAASEGTDPPVFRLIDLSVLYRQRLEQLGVLSPDVHTTRLKEQLLFHIPQLEAHHQGKHVLLAFEKDIGSILGEANKYNDAIHLAKAAEMIRHDMLQHKTPPFNNFDETLEEVVPPSLLAFICMIEHGADIKSQIHHGASKSDLAISQLLLYNCFARYKEGSHTHRHSKNRETPFAVYIGMCLFAKTRKRQLIDMLHENGISISYDRVLEISAHLGESVVTQYVSDGVVCPPTLKKKLFTTAAVDNIDHNPTATTAKTSFHGTSVSLFQHPDMEYAGEERQMLKVDSKMKRKTVPELPESFTNVHPAYISGKPNPPSTVITPFPAPNSIQTHLKEEYAWLEDVSLVQDIDDAVNITWSAHHASLKRSKSFGVSISSLLPLLRDQAQSVATIKHCMEKIRGHSGFS